MFTRVCFFQIYFFESIFIEKESNLTIDMFLKRLEIAGFKSFPDKIKLDFPAGITAVVGPNGSGKSNIGDAIRWVMGEQSVKSLRGAKMEDVIFAGTQHRKPLGYAEVHMLINNDAGLLPIAFNEVTVTRRVYRSGESEYLINGAGCRMKDIHRLFMDTGVGREGYSIIGQGRVDEILSTRSEDRRHLFEEAAGIVKYKARRHEAFLKLSAEKENLARAEDLITELSAQMEPLAEQAEQAKLYLNLRDQYKILHINLFLEDVTELEEQKTKISNSLTTVSQHKKEDEQKLVSNQKHLSELKEEEITADNKYKEVNRQIIQQVRLIEQAESDLKLAEAQQRYNKSNAERIAKELEKQEDTIKQKNLEIEKEETECAGLKESILFAQESLREKEEAYNSLEASLSEQESAYDNFQNEIMTRSQKASAKWAELQQQEATVTVLEERQSRLNETKITVDIDACKAKHQELSEFLSAHIQKEEELNQEIAIFNQTHAKLVKDAETLHNKIQSAQQERHTAVSRHKLLSEMARDYGGYYASVKTVLKKKDADPIFGKGILGTAGDLITIPQEYEHALSVGLGASSQNIITATEADAQRAIAFLKSSKSGRATFLPISTMKPRIITHEMDILLTEPGVIGLANKLISFDSVYAPVYGNLLGNLFVVEHLDQAVALSKKYRQSYRLVTLEGDLISPGGAMTGGSTGKQSLELLGRSREITELTDKISTYSQQLNFLEQDQRNHGAKVLQVEQALADSRQKLQAAAIEKNNRQNLVNNNESNLKQLQQQLFALEQEKDQITTDISNARHAIVVLKEEWTQENQAIEDIKKSQEDNRRWQADSRKLREDAMALLTDHKIQLSKLTQSLQTAQENIARIDNELELLRGEETSLKDELAKLSEPSSYDSQQSQKELESFRSELLNQQADLSSTEQSMSKIKAAIVKLDAEHQENMESLSRLNRESDRLESRFEQTESESRRLHNEIWDSYGLTFQSAMDFRNPEYTGTSLRREEKHIKSEIANLGNVNVGAIDAYQALRQRHDFLTSQRDDILKAEEQLQELIKELTEQMEQQFTVQFKLIARNFDDVFREMFGGGKASLVMSDPDNVLESGIEITAQPPGKNLQSMSLLSGGERALTAIALLFGILRMKPSPFCILDEIEAALDDANVLRFAEYLKTYAGGTQFIVITHRKGTMECADTLYGVTMQEMGISKMVSVNFN